MFKLYSPLTLDFDTPAVLTASTERGTFARLERDMSGDWSIDGDALDRGIAGLIGECGELVDGLEALSKLDEGETLTPDRVIAGTLRIESSIAEPDEIIAEALGITYRVMLEDNVWAARHTSWATPVAQDADLAALLFRLLEEAAEFGREADEIDNRAASLMTIQGQTGRWTLHTTLGGWRTQFMGQEVREFPYISEAVEQRYAIAAGRGSAWS